MKSQFVNVKWFLTGILCLSLVACGGNDTNKTDETTFTNNSKTNSSTTTPKLSAKNQELAENCSQNNQEACKQLVESLIKECSDGNAQSCVDSAVIFIKLNDQAVKDNNNQLATQSYSYAVNALIKACDLKHQSACNSLKELSDNILNHLKTIKVKCEKQNNTEACDILQNSKQLLENSCQSGRTQDCQYLKNL